MRISAKRKVEAENREERKKKKKKKKTAADATTPAPSLLALFRPVIAVMALPAHAVIATFAAYYPLA
jgi:hypothetical protein